MSLQEYVRKRKFDNTPEPAPAELDPKPTQGRFFIQRHDATRLHYDFRLEIAGTLKSWAVPKGPSLVPLSKNLAMHVEDHPLDYGEFEGNIPKGNYGAGSVMLWDRGSFDVLGDGDGESQIERGDLKIRLDGVKIKGEFALIRMKNRGKGNEWLLIKKRDEHADAAFDIEALAYSVKTGRTQQEIAHDLPAKTAASASPGAEKAKATRTGTAKTSSAAKTSKPTSGKTTSGKSGRAKSRRAKATPAQPEPDDPEPEVDLASLAGARAASMPQNVTPMMAVRATKAPEGKKWLYEIKWDGIRAICYIRDGRVNMVSRNGNSFDRQFPELTVIPHAITASEAILDGEICLLDERGRASFSLIQPRIHQTDPNTISHAARRAPAVFFAFDLLYCDGYDLRAVPLIERKQVLETLFRESGSVRLSRYFQTSGAEMLSAAEQAGIEGILAKQIDSKYETKRSDCWQKIKITTSQDFVICGFTHGERSTFSSLVLGAYDGGKLVYVGNVGTGFNERTLTDIFSRLKPLQVDVCPFKPKPAMLRKASWVEPKLVCECKFSEWTHDAHLRAPVFLRLRTDKRPEDCALDDSVAEDAAEPAATKAAHTAPPQPEPASKSAPEPPPARNPDDLLFPKTAKEITLRIDGRALKFTNLDKIYYPKDRVTKRDLLNYYDQVAHLIIPHLEGRPLSLKRYPNGIHEEYFFQKDTPEGYPDWLRVEPIHSEHRGAPIRYVVADDRSTLLFLTNLGCIDQNPWMSRMETLDYPDYILIDLDPQECSFDKIIEAALLVKQALDEIGMAGYPKTTGGDGMHVFVPIEPRYTYEQARSYAAILSQLVVSRRPELFTTPRAVAKRRKNRVYFDYLQISSSKTIAAPYVLRAYDGAPVAAPLDWSEVKAGLRPHQFNIKNAVARFRETGDLFKPVLTNRQRIEPSLKRLAKLLESDSSASSE